MCSTAPARSFAVESRETLFGCNSAGFDYAVGDLPRWSSTFCWRTIVHFSRLVFQLVFSEGPQGLSSTSSMATSSARPRIATCDAASRYRSLPGSTTAGIDFSMRVGVSSEWISGPEPLTIFDGRGVELVGMVRVNSTPCFPFLGPCVPTPQLQQIVGLTPGTYFVQLGSQLHDGIVCHDCPPTSGTPIVLHPGQYLPYAELRERAGASASAVRSPKRWARRQSTKITVEVISGAGQEIAHAFTDMSGRYSVGPLAPGLLMRRP